ncbi:MAG: hypothetical protein GXY91_08585 [Clostridia bacterium]|nr:hypothetical protein [Clostridia bacterium]
MNLHKFIPPLCLNCEVPLEKRLKTTEEDGLSYQISYCPNCQEVYEEKIYEQK